MQGGGDSSTESPCPWLQVDFMVVILLDDYLWLDLGRALSVR